MVTGSGSSWRVGLFALQQDYIYVKDVADAYLTLAEKMDDPSIVGQSFNFSTDKPYNVIEIVQEILQLMNADYLAPIIRNNASHEIPAQHLNSTKAEKLLGWKAKYGVARGLKETIDWYTKFFTPSHSIKAPILHAAHILSDMKSL